MTELLAELGPLLEGCTVREVQALPPRDLLIILEPAPSPGGPPILRLRICAASQYARIHLQQGRVQSHSGPEGPFFQALNQELTGATLRRFEQVRGDRIVRIEFGSTPSGRRRALMAELVGRHSNLVLVGPADEILQILVQPKESPSRRGTRPARLLIGRGWEPPGSGARAPDRPGTDLISSFPDPKDPPPGPVKDRAPLSWRVEQCLGNDALAQRRADLRKKLIARLTRKLARARSLTKGLGRRARAVESAERVLQDGELLKSIVGQVQRGQTQIEVADWFSEGTPMRTLALDSRRSPAENVQAYFARYKKLLRGKESIDRELALAHGKVAGLTELLERADDPAQDPQTLDEEAVAAGLLDASQESDPRKKRAPAQRLPYRTYTVVEGVEVRVGRTAKDNDALTFRHARGNDLWLHTRDCPGSHVVVRIERGQTPSTDTLLEAGMLAVHFSPARKGGSAPVHVVPVKEVHKPRGAKAGLVTLSGGRILNVRVQQARLDEILRGSTPSAES